MKFNFDKISKGISDHSIFIDSMYQPGAFNRKVLGFQWGNEGESNIKFTERVDYLLNETELQILALGKVLEIIDKFIKTVDYPQLFNIYFNGNEATKLFISNTETNLLVKELIIKAKLDLELLDRSGYEVNIETSLGSSSLEGALKLALYEYRLINDFQNEPLYLSSVAAKYFDNLFLDLKKDALIQYISPTEVGIPGAQKRMITPEDEIPMNNIINQVYTEAKFPTRINRLSQLRRNCLIVRDADIVLIVTSLYGGETIDGDGALLYFAAQQYKIPVYILDSETLGWYTKSKNEKRDLVKAKRLPNLKSFLNIGIYCDPILVEKTWDTFKKVFKN